MANNRQSSFVFLLLQYDQLQLDYFFLFLLEIGLNSHYKVMRQVTVCVVSQVDEFT